MSTNLLHGLTLIDYARCHMSKILQISSESVTIGLDDGSLQDYPINCCNGFKPEIGIEVEVYSDGTKTLIVKKVSIQNVIKHPNSVEQNGRHKVNKLAYVLLTFFLGGIGIHKFYSGHIFLGILYLLFCWTGIPSLIAFIEFIIAICKSADENGEIGV